MMKWAQDKHVGVAFAHFTLLAMPCQAMPLESPLSLNTQSSSTKQNIREHKKEKVGTSFSEDWFFFFFFGCFFS